MCVYNLLVLLSVLLQNTQGNINASKGFSCEVLSPTDKGKLHPYVHEIQFCQGNPVGYSSGDQNMLERKKSNEDPQRNRIFLLSSLVYNLEIFSR